MFWLNFTNLFLLLHRWSYLLFRYWCNLLVSRLAFFFVVSLYLEQASFSIFRYLIHFSNSLLVAVILKTLTIVILPNKLFKLTQIAKERNSSPSIHESRFQDPKVAACFSKKSFRTSRLAVEITLRSFSQLLSW